LLENRIHGEKGGKSFDLDETITPARRSSAESLIQGLETGSELASGPTFWGNEVSPLSREIHVWSRFTGAVAIRAKRTNADRASFPRQ
jgi:hypothetical protein